MRVLHIGINRVPNLGISRAMRDRGHAVESVDIGETARIKHLLSTERPDMLFMQLHENNAVPMGMVKELKDRGTFVVDWFGDVRDDLPRAYVDRFRAVNVTACTNMRDIATMQAMGHDARFLQVGYDEEIYTDQGKRLSGIAPIVFMGNNYGMRFPLSQHRADMVEAMRDAFKLDFAVYGKGWGTHALDPITEACVYRSTTVAIHADHYDIEGFFSDRALRASACGARVVTVTGLPLEQCVAKVREELPFGRDPIAAGWAKHNHTWHQRIKQLERWQATHREARTR
jgi:hypothetical protein